MGSISGFGIGFAALTAAWAASMTPALAAPAPKNDLQIRLSQLRNAKGMIHACLTRDKAYFPDCKADSRAIRLSVPAREAAELHFVGIPEGRYALSIIHDENGNGKLDTFAKIPREGYGFSGNPPMRFGPPKFDEAKFDLTAGSNEQEVRLRYLL